MARGATATTDNDESLTDLEKQTQPPRLGTTVEDGADEEEEEEAMRALV
jgi:hypothetical protein